ncbi:hypothetical protein AMC82_PC00025 (plasmid) [Rhizobium phaseoli]|uniref:hypothetical protein n=1 Tax=Rhizobium phaseoli TaxID=396 RepID=UPI0007E99189|nr:hypothetical protein [Rhizobium phaseoli]ANL68589.1 hypothetical protein AMC84_PC00025 [Rhizobium phaseoli]ANL81398.1 hypothetical protein AMC82_PC00025 [Rhizobium phaseoli]
MIGVAVYRFFHMGSSIALFIGTMLVASCTPSDRDFATNGAGSDLMSQRTVVATDSLDAYFGEICRQADLPVSGPRPLRCQTGGFDELSWQSMVKAGFNDIDHRCDLYLSWLENKRNEKPFVDATISTVGTTAAGVLGVAVPGSTALEYVGLALGFTSQIYNAYYTRALLGIEPSTIKITVEGRRLAFRNEFIDARYREKGDVVYVLRSYLKLCTPQTITMDVNAFARAGATGVEPPQYQNLLLERRAMDTIRSVTSPALVVKPLTTPTVSPAVRLVFVTAGYSDAQLEQVRAALCVHSSDPANTKTMAAIKMWEDQVYEDEPNNPLHQGRVDDVEFNGINMQQGLRDAPRCEDRWHNFEERALFQGKPETEKSFITAINKIGLSKSAMKFGDAASRKAVADARTKCALMPINGVGMSDLTDDLYNKIIEWSGKTEGSTCG